MKVYQFLKKFLFGSSSIKRVFLCDDTGHERILPDEDLRDPGRKDSVYYEELRSTVRSFRISGENLTIYCY